MLGARRRTRVMLRTNKSQRNPNIVYIPRAAYHAPLAVPTMVQQGKVPMRARLHHVTSLVAHAQRAGVKFYVYYVWVRPYFSACASVATFRARARARNTREPSLCAAKLIASSNDHGRLFSHACLGLGSRDYVPTSLTQKGSQKHVNYVDGDRI